MVRPFHPYSNLFSYRVFISLLIELYEVRRRASYGQDYYYSEDQSSMFIVMWLYPIILTILFLCGIPEGLKLLSKHIINLQIKLLKKETQNDT